MADEKEMKILEEHEKQHAHPAGLMTCLVIVVVVAVAIWAFIGLRAAPAPDADGLHAADPATAGATTENLIRRELAKLDLSSLRDDSKVSYDAETGEVEFNCTNASTHIEIITYSVFLSHFSRIGHAVFSVPGVQRLRFAAKIYVADGYNNMALEEVMRLTIAKQEFENNELDGLRGREMLPVLERSCDEYFVHEWLTRHFEEDGHDH